MTCGVHGIYLKFGSFNGIDPIVPIFKGRFSKLVSIKILLKTKRRISFRGSFVYSKENHLKQGEKFQILKMLLAILFIYL
jgi:hypothetical protein